MREIVVLGAGLSGLVAAYELEKQGLPATLIEIKRQTGGSIRSVREGDFIVDTGPFALEDTLDPALMAELGLEGSLYPLKEYEEKDAVSFAQGAEQLVEALTQRLSGPRLMRMAVSSIGPLETGRLGICLENGLLLDAKKIIVALPAPYAARAFLSYLPDLALRLSEFRYDIIQRLALGYRTEDLAAGFNRPWDMAYAFIHHSDHPQRTPPGHTLLQVGVRQQPGLNTLEEILSVIQAEMGLPSPLMQRIDFWPEADTLTCFEDGFPAQMQQIRAMLPPEIALIGSDYLLEKPSHRGVTRLDERIRLAQAAARQLL